MPFTSFAANSVLASITGTTTYLALLTGYPSDTDTGSTLAEITGSGYVRKALAPASWTTPAAGITYYNAALSWTVSADWTQTILAYAIVDAATAGNLLGYAYMTNPSSINVGSGASATTVNMAANSLVIEVN